MEVALATGRGPAMISSPHEAWDRKGGPCRPFR
jgi:hypothetical protein